MLVASKRARLSYEELCQLRWLVGGILTLVSLWTLVYLEVRSELLILATALTVSLAMLFPFLPGRIPSAIWKVVTPLLVVVVLTDFLFSHPDIIPPLVRMIILLVFVRSLQYRTRREDLQLILLCLFMVVISGVLTLSLTFGVQILIFTPCAMALLFIINLTESIDRKDEVPSRLWEDFRFVSFFRRLGMVTDLRLISFAFLLFLGVLLVSSLFFIVTPRFRIDQAMPFLNLKGKARSGFSEMISFGDVIEIIEDESVALRVDLPSNQEIPIDPYWRMVVLDEYYKRSFRMSFSARSKRKPYSQSYFRAPGSGRIEVSGNDPDAHKWTFYLEGGISKFLPLVGHYQGLRFQNRKILEFNRPLQVTNTANISSSVLFYQIEGMEPKEIYPLDNSDRELGGLDTLVLPPKEDNLPYKVDYPQTTLAIPGDEANLSTLVEVAGQITQGQELTPREFSRRAVEYLTTRHGYSLNVNIPLGKGDELTRWLQSEEAGHCELFAGSFTLLARTAGFPARLVTGFKGGLWSGFEKYYMIRNRDAHAWCEIFDPEEGWIRVDPSPGSGIAGGAAGEGGSIGALMVDTSWRAYLDSLRILWYRRIVNFDQAEQERIAAHLKEMSGVFLGILKVELQDRITALKGWLGRPWQRAEWLQIVTYLEAVPNPRGFGWKPDTDINLRHVM